MGEYHPAHAWITARLVCETVVFAAVFACCATVAGVSAPVRWLAIVLAGCWIHRIYVVGHEAVHRKLLPGWPRVNDLLGQLLLLPMLVPLPVYRKIHYFHHAHNRRDIHTSALDIVVVSPQAGPLRRACCYLVWFCAVFAGGFFIHSVVSIVLFLLLPLKVARRISPAFSGWGARDRLLSWVALLAGLGVHTLIYQTCGPEVWAQACGYPMLVFAWVYSLFVYIYHYRTGIGTPTQRNVRSLQRNPLIAYWLLNFHEHTAHHQNPNLPWYQLPTAGAEHGGDRMGFFAAVLQQLRGPTLVASNVDNAAGPQPGAHH